MVVSRPSERSEWSSVVLQIATLFMLTPGERRTLHGFAETLLGLPADGFPSIHDNDLITRIDAHLVAGPRMVALAFRVGLVCFEWGGLISCHARYRRFCAIAADRQLAYLRMWRRSWWLPKKLIRRLLESLVMTLYYGHASATQAVGWTQELSPARPVAPLPEGQWSRFAPPDCAETLHVDVAVIGSGAGGAVVAETLARAGRDVVILESGDLRDAASYRGDVLRATNECYRDAGTTATFGWPVILVPYGEAVGGTTIINSGTMLAPPASVLARWQAERGLSGWGAADLAPHIAAVTEMVRAVPVPDAVQGPHAKIFAQGAARLGHTTGPLPRNAPDCQGSGLCCFGCPTNAKLSMALTVIPAALKHGARLFANCAVQRLRHAHGRVTGLDVEWTQGVDRPARRVTITAKQVVVAAGTMRTPLLLFQSGLRDPYAHLGRHLTLHPAVKVFAQMPDPIAAWSGVPQGMYSDALSAIGAKMESIFLPPAYLSLSVMTSGAQHREAMAHYPHLAGFGAMLSDGCEGRIVRLPRGHGIPYYCLSKQDLPRYRDTLALLADIFFAAGAERVYPAWHPVPMLTRAEGSGPLRAHKPRRIDFDLQAFHPLGTCRMGGDPSQGAVDPEGRLYGMSNCYIADGSTIPTPLGVNPQITIMAVARKIAAEM